MQILIKHGEFGEISWEYAHVEHSQGMSNVLIKKVLKVQR